jgi:5-methylcytosine-specific restriction endonuclease McrA
VSGGGRRLRRITDLTQRTLRSVKARNRKRREQGHVCAKCGEPLTDANTELDHTTPYRITKTTNPHDMQALCRPCNRKKG